MARTAATLEGGVRISDYITLGVVARQFPADLVESVLMATGRASQRHRDLPAHVVIYYVIALALFTQASCREVLRCLMEGIRWLQCEVPEPRIAGKSAISQARSRLGWEPLQRLHDEVVKPIATQDTRGAWYRQWRIVSLDGCTLDVPDDPAIESAFGRPSAARGTSAFPQIRFVSLVESGTHVLFATRMGGFSSSERVLADGVIPALAPGMLCLADRGFYGFQFWGLARATGAELLWRVNSKLGLPREEELEDGSYLSTLYPTRERRHPSKGVRVRVIEYTLQGIPPPPDPEDEPTYRLITTILDPKVAPAVELAALYPERWEIESAFDELKTHLRGRQMLLRSKTPDLIRQEFYGLMMAHFAIRGLIHEAAFKAEIDPDRLSFIHAVRVVRRTLPHFAALSPHATRSSPTP
ncbi:MAG: IS4 family transposase [Desulfomonile tiedjei]|nr:IS4 family transposase [Desulfomonile tiedjei]